MWHVSPKPGLAIGREGCYQLLRRSGYFPWASRFLHFLGKTPHWLGSHFSTLVTMMAQSSKSNWFLRVLNPPTCQVANPRCRADWRRTSEPLSPYGTRRLFREHRAIGDTIQLSGGYVSINSWKLDDSHFPSIQTLLLSGLTDSYWAF